MPAAIGLVAVVCVATAAGTADRLDRFREIARTRLHLLELTGSDPAPGALSELYGLVDEEILESLRVGGPFASPEFIQERLDALNSAWGGAAFRITPLEGRTDLVVGQFTLSALGRANSVRLYRRSGHEARLVEVMLGDGVPTVHGWPRARDGGAQFVVSWLGPHSGRGSRALRVELWRQRADGAALVWSTTDRLDADLRASAFKISAGEITLRYELRYPGWKPGCEGQTEQEDVYRSLTSTDRLALARRRIFNAWHRELQVAVGRLLAALHREDDRTLAELVRDRAVRARLPRSLAAEPACDAWSAETPTTVTVAATAQEDGRRQPWSLQWSREPRGWRLAAAAPVLQ